MRYFSLPSLALLVAALPSTLVSSFSFDTARNLLAPRQDAPPNTTQIPPTNSTSMVYKGKDKNSQDNVTFTITSDPTGEMVYFRLSAPARYSWVAIGVGSEMKGALMFVMYRGRDSNKVILSARVATGNTEPEWKKGRVNLTLVNPPSNDPHLNGVRNDTYYAAGLCRQCGKVGVVKIDPQSTQQPFIYAVGPSGHHARTDAPDAPLRRHIAYGTFVLDMTKAIGDQLPRLAEADVQGAVNPGDNHQDRDVWPAVHAVIMVMSFLIIFPLGVFSLRILDRVKLHMIFQTTALVLVVMGFILGLFISKYYNRSKHYNSAHQIIGILIFIGLLTQWTFGFLHHRTYKRNQRGIPALIKPHKLGLGSALMGLGLVEAAIGFKFAQGNAWNLVYIPLAIAVVVLLVASQFLKRCCAGRFGRRKNLPAGPSYAASGGVYGNAAPHGAPAYDPPAGPYAGGGGGRSGYDTPTYDPPAYGQQPVRPREFA